MPKQLEKCEGCGQEPSLPLHTCPFMEELDEDFTMCSCCDECTYGCEKDARKL